MKVSLLFILILLGLQSCNVIEMHHKASVKSLKRSGVEEYHFLNDSTDLHYYAGGNGQPILFLHGFGGDAQLSWKKYLKRYSKTNFVIAPDILWFGKSKSKLEPTLASQGKVMLQLLEKLDVDSVVVLGQSYGGFITMEMNLQNSKRIESIIIVNSPGPTFNFNLIQNLCQEKGVSKEEDLFVFDDVEGLNRLMDISYKKGKKIPKGIAKKVIDIHFKPNHSQKSNMIQSLKEDGPKHLKFYAENKFNSLVIWSDSDVVFPLSEGEKLAHLLKCEIKVVQNEGHISLINKTKQGFKMIDAFINHPNP